MNRCVKEKPFFRRRDVYEEMPPFEGVSSYSINMMTYLTFNVRILKGIEQKISTTKERIPSTIYIGCESVRHIRYIFNQYFQRLDTKKACRANTRVFRRTRLKGTSKIKMLSVAVILIYVKIRLIIRTLKIEILIHSIDHQVLCIVPQPHWKKINEKMSQAMELVQCANRFMLWFHIFVFKFVTVDSNHLT